MFSRRWGNGIADRLLGRRGRCHVIRILTNHVGGETVGRDGGHASGAGNRLRVIVAVSMVSCILRWINVIDINRFWGSQLRKNRGHVKGGTGRAVAARGTAEGC